MKIVHIDAINLLFKSDKSCSDKSLSRWWWWQLKICRESLLRSTNRQRCEVAFRIITNTSLTDQFVGKLRSLCCVSNYVATRPTTQWTRNRLEDFILGCLLISKIEYLHTASARWLLYKTAICLLTIWDF